MYIYTVVSASSSSSSVAVVVRPSVQRRHGRDDVVNAWCAIEPGYLRAQPGRPAEADQTDRLDGAPAGRRARAQFMLRAQRVMAEQPRR